MALGDLKSRIGGSTDPALVQRAFLQHRDDPPMKLYESAIHSANLALEGLNASDDGNKEKPGKLVAFKWLKVVYQGIHKLTAELTTSKDRSNLERVAEHLGRHLPEQNGDELISHWALCRTRPLDGPLRLPDGIRGKEDEALVLIPLERWDARNGLFVDSQIEVGQEICVGGAEPLNFPGTGGCVFILLVLKLPRQRT